MSTLRVNNPKYVFHIRRKILHASRQLFHLSNLKLVFSISALAKKNYDGIIEKSLRIALIIVFLQFRLRRGKKLIYFFGLVCNPDASRRFLFF